MRRLNSLADKPKEVKALDKKFRNIAGWWLWATQIPTAM